MGWLILIVLLLIVLILLLSCVKIVPQATAMVVERLGGYRATCCKEGHFKRAGCRFCTAAGYHKG